MRTEFKTLKGRVITHILVSKNEDEIIFTCKNGDKIRMHHYQECCESVTIDDIDGDLNDLIGSEILEAVESSESNYKEREYGDGDGYTWTFYRISTFNGDVVIKWYGTSNGFYSESVDIELIKNK